MRYGIAHYTSGFVHVYASDAGEYTQHAAQRIVKRHALAMSRLAKSNPPSFDRGAQRRTLLQLAEQLDARVPGGEEIAAMIAEAERCEL